MVVAIGAAADWFWRFLCLVTPPAVYPADEFSSVDEGLMMAEKTIELEIPLLLPDIADDQDRCLDQLENLLKNQRGIIRAHLERAQVPVRLCLHYDPNLTSLPVVQQIARQVGSEFSQRYRHQTIPFTHMDTADAAPNLAQVLEQLPGMLHAQVNYAAGLIFVAYDTEMLDQTKVEQTIRRMGQRLVLAPERATRP